MFAYFVFLGLILLLLTSSYFEKNKKNKKLIYIYIIVLLVIFGGFRIEFGYDTINYSVMFDSILPFGEGFQASRLGLHGEIGFHFLIGLLKSFGFMHVQFLFSFIIIFNYIMYYKSLKNLSPNFEFTLLVLIFLHFLGRDIGIIRQAIAISLTLYSIKFIIEKKLMYFISIVFIASLFHSSALVFLPAYFISYLKFSRLKLMILLLAGFMFSFIPPEFMNDAFTFFTGSSIKYFDLGNSEPVSPISITFLRRVAPVLIILFFYDKFILNIKHSSIIINLYFFGLFIGLFFLNQRIYFIRLVTYYLILEVLIYSYLFIILKDKNMKYSYAFMIALVCILFIFNLIETSPDQFAQYDNIIVNWLKFIF
jgi:hypothetical protein